MDEYHFSLSVLFSLYLTFLFPLNPEGYHTIVNDFIGIEITFGSQSVPAYNGLSLACSQIVQRTIQIFCKCVCVYLAHVIEPVLTNTFSA